MRRHSFRTLSDSTTPPVEKMWVFDTFTFNVPQLHTKHKYLTRFVNVHSSGDNDTKRLGKYRSYGHAVYDAKSIEGCLQQLRAFVRPTHGEHGD